MSAIEKFRNALDNLGAFASLEELRKLYESASDDVKKNDAYHWLEGLLHGRSINEELENGGYDKSTDGLYNAAYNSALELKEKAVSGDPIARERLLDLHANINDAIQRL